MLKSVNICENSIIIFDCDEVLLDTWGAMKGVYEVFTGKILTDREWADINRDYEFHPRRYTKFGEFFTHSDVLWRIPPVKGMPELVSELTAKGVKMCVLTSVNKEGKEARRHNLATVFGPVFSAVHCVGKESKAALLSDYSERYRRTTFIDDSIRHIKDSVDIVTHPIWMDTGYLSHRSDELDFKKVRRAESVEALRELLLF